MSKKREFTSWKIVILFAFLILGIGLYIQPVCASNKENFIWGVNGHSYVNNPTYPKEKLNDQIRKAANLGVTHYRINMAPGYTNGVYDWSYMDSVVNTAETYGLKLYVVLYSSLGGTSQELNSLCHDIASHYGSRIEYYQMGNEQDNRCIISGDGSLTNMYDLAAYTDIREKLKAMSSGLKAGCPTAKRVINMGYKHTGFIELLNADGVEWDTTGLDWYSNMDGSSANMLTIVNKIGTYKQQEIIVSELNTRDGNMSKTEQEQADYIQQNAVNAYESGHPKLHGFFVYELLDEMAFTDGEGHYGLMYCDRSGNVGQEKIAYGAYKKTIMDCTHGIAAIEPGQILVDDDFESNETNTAPVGWSVTNGTNASCTVDDDTATSNKAMKLWDNSVSKTAVPAAQAITVHTFEPQNNKIVAEWDFKETVLGKYTGFCLQSGGTTAVEILTINTLTSGGVNYGQCLGYRDASGNKWGIQSMSSDTWYKVTIVADIQSKTYDIYVNNVLKINGAQFRNNVDSIDRIYFGTSIDWTTIYTYIDNVRVFMPQPTNAGMSGVKIIGGQFTDFQGNTILKSVGEANSVKANIAVMNLNDTATPFMMIVCEYGNKNCLEKIKSGIFELGAKDTMLFSEGFSNMEHVSGSTVRVFIWNNLEMMEPLGKKFELQ